MKNCKKLKDEQMRSILFEYYEEKGKSLRFFEEFRLGRKTRADALLDELKKLAFESEHFFPDDTLTDQPERVLAGEIIREKMLRLLDKEIPHGTAVSIEKMRERSDGIMDVEATIFCERESHKGIIIGKGGNMLKKISTYARQDMENFFGCKINLQCWVKVKEGWRNREGLIHNFGLD